MKKVCYIILLPILFLQAGGALWYFHIQQENLKQEMAEVTQNPGTACITMQLSRSEFQKGRIGNHEIYVNGSMYDIRSFNISGDMVQLIVVNDTKEERIIEHIKGYVNTNTPGSKGAATQLIKLLTLDYINQSFNQDLSLTETREDEWSVPCTSFQSHLSTVTSPPPESV